MVEEIIYVFSRTRWTEIAQSQVLEQVYRISSMRESEACAYHHGCGAESLSRMRVDDDHVECYFEPGFVTLSVDSRQCPRCLSTTGIVLTAYELLKTVSSHVTYDVRVPRQPP